MRKVFRVVCGLFTTRIRGGSGFRLFNKVRVQGHDNCIELLESYHCRNNRVIIHGSHNHITINGSSVINTLIEVRGDHTSFSIGLGGIIRRAQILLRDNGSSIAIGKQFDSGIGLEIAAMEGASISIGDDCLLSNNCIITNSDAHSIYIDEIRVNRAKDIKIGNHVWFGRNAVVLKGASVADGDIIGHSAICTGGEYAPDYVYAGNPAKSIKKITKWDSVCE